MKTVEARDSSKPDETRTFGHGHADILNIGEGTLGRLVLEPGWKWSVDVKPMAKTEFCEAPHFQYLASGRLRVVMVTGQEFDLAPGSVSCLPAGHDA